MFFYMYDPKVNVTLMEGYPAYMNPLEGEDVETIEQQLNPPLDLFFKNPAS
jgi:hypothetical protein